MVVGPLLRSSANESQIQSPQPSRLAKAHRSPGGLFAFQRHPPDCSRKAPSACLQPLNAAIRAADDGAGGKLAEQAGSHHAGNGGDRRFEAGRIGN